LGLKDDVELSTYCLEKLNIALVPGSAFGAPGYVRFSFATSMDNILGLHFKIPSQWHLRILVTLIIVATGCLPTQ
jgi:aspartate/methionine/tyrosine aminotransferase